MVRFEKAGFTMKKSLFILMSVQFLVYLGFGLIIPVLPEVILQQNYNEVHVGGLLTVYALASFFTAPLWGMLSDRIGRKTLILIGLIGFSLSFWLFSLFFNSLVMLYLSRIVGGLFSGALYTAVTGFIADLSDEENRNKYMGFMGMSIGLGFIFGPAIGGVLGHISLETPFIVSSILLLVIFVYAFIILKEPDRTGEANKRTILPRGALSLWSYRIKYLFLFSFMVTFLLAGLEATFQLFQIERVAITPLQIGYLFMFSGFVDAAIQGGVVRRIKNGTETTWLLYAQIITAIGLVLTVFTTNIFWAGLSLCVFTAGNALARTTIVSLTSKESGGRYGTAAGMTYSMDNLGRIIGPLLFAWLFTKQPDNIYVLSGILAILAIGLIFAYRKSTKTLKNAA